MLSVCLFGVNIYKNNCILHIHISKLLLDNSDKAMRHNIQKNVGYMTVNVKKKQQKKTFKTLFTVCHPFIVNHFIAIKYAPCNGNWFVTLRKCLHDNTMYKKRK